jgi:hypothetical protein
MAADKNNPKTKKTVALKYDQNTRFNLVSL